MTTSQDYPERVYAVRASEKFAAQWEAAYDRLERADYDAAEDWRTGLQRAKSSLATLPSRCGVAAENRLYQKKHPGVPLPVFLYRHRRNTWRLLLTVHEVMAEDTAHVMFQQLLHAAQKPLTKWPDDGPTI